MNIEESVRRLRIEVTTTGAENATRQLGDVASASSAYAAALAKQQRQYELMAKQQAAFNATLAQQAAMAQQASAANDNSARSSSGFADVLAKIAVYAAAAYLGIQAIVTALKVFWFVATAGPRLLAEAWDLASTKLEDYRKLAEQAASADLSTSFFQKITRSATDAKLPVDALTESFKNLEKVTAEKLGGSDFQNRLEALSGAGNFQGNTGVSQLAQANTAEQKFRAIVSLVDQAMAKGERLAALDLTSKFLSPALQQALTKDSEYLHNMLDAADKLSNTKIVSDEDVGRALDLQRRYDAAVAILEQRWHPIQDLLTQAGIKMQSAWVGIVEAVANAVDWVTKLVMKIGEIPQTFWDYIKKGAVTAAPLIGGAVAGPFGAAAGAAINVGVNTGLIGGNGEVAKTDDYTTAVNKLAAGLKNVNTVQQAVAQTNAVQAAVWKDTSRAVDTAAKSDNDFVDRAINNLQKHVLQQEADAKAVGLGAGALAQFQAEAAETAAVLANSGKETDAQKAKFDSLKAAAFNAADGLARVKLNSSIEFQTKTMGMSSEDVAILQQLVPLYGTNIPKAIASTEFEQLKLLNQQKQVNAAVAQFGTDFVGGLLRGESAMKSLTSAAQSLVQTLANQNIKRFMEGGSLFGNQSLNSMQGAAGIAGAGLSGYQSGNWMTGALGGAMAGAAFGPVGAALGGVAGALGGLFGASKKAEDEIAQAQAQWKPMCDDVQAFNAAPAATTSAPKPKASNDNTGKKEPCRDRDQHLSAA